MEYIIKNEKSQNFGAFSSNQRKTNMFSILSYKDKNSFNENLKTNKNIVHVPFPELKEFYSKNTNIVGLRLPDYELINLKRKEAPHVFSTRYKYIDENRKRLYNKKLSSQENSESSKLKNTFFSNFRQNRINLDNNLKFEKINYVSIPFEESEKIHNLNKIKKGINDLNENNFSEKIMKLKNNKKLRNNIILPNNLEYKRKNYMKLSGDSNFMEKYEYYLLNLNKNNSQNKQIIKRENNSINNYYNNSVKSRNNFNTYNKNFFNINNIQQIKPYKYNQLYLNTERNNLKKECLTDKSNISTNNKYLSKYLDDSYIKKLKQSQKDINNINNINKSKTINSLENKIIYLNTNYFDEAINQLKRRVLCINEKNEDLVLGKAISLLRKENERINNEIDKNMNTLCTIKNFSLTHGNEQIIPLINEIILNKKYQKNAEYQNFEKLTDSSKKNKNKFDLLNKELKVFNLEKNYKYVEEEKENGLGNIYYNIVSRKNNKKSRFLRRLNKSVIPFNYKKRLNFYNVQKLKRYKSYDNKDNLEDDDSYYIPSVYNNKKVKIVRPPIDNNYNFNSNSNNNHNINNNKNNTSNEIINKPEKRNLPKLHLNYIGSIPSLMEENFINPNTITNNDNFQSVANKSYKKRIKRINKNENHYKNNNLNLKISNIKINNKTKDVKENIKIKENNRENLETQMTENETINKETIKNIIFDEEKEKDKINDLKIRELLIKENKENIAKNYIIHKKFIRRKNIRTKSIYYKLKPRLDKISYYVYEYDPEKNKDKELNEEKTKKFERGRKNHLSIIFRNLPKGMGKKKKSPKKKAKNKNNNYENIIYYEPPKKDTNDYTKFLSILKAEDDLRQKSNENKKIHFSNNSPNKNKKRISRLFTMNKNPNNDKKQSLLTQKTFKDFKEESIDEDELIDFKKYHEKEKKFKISNLTKFKNQINKMKNMSVNEYINYMENYFSPKNHNDNNNDNQERINMFLESMRKNIEKFRGKQNILQINCQPIDYIITIGNGFGNYFIEDKEIKSQRNESFKNDLNSSNN